RSEGHSGRPPQTCTANTIACRQKAPVDSVVLMIGDLCARGMTVAEGSAPGDPTHVRPPSDQMYAGPARVRPALDTLRPASRKVRTALRARRTCHPAACIGTDPHASSDAARSARRQRPAYTVVAGARGIADADRRIHRGRIHGQRGCVLDGSLQAERNDPAVEVGLLRRPGT